jgi:predicted O-methyltransferase YrrM
MRASCEQHICPAQQGKRNIKNPRLLVVASAPRLEMDRIMTARPFLAPDPGDDATTRGMPDIAAAAQLAPVDHGRTLLDLLRRKWGDVPGGVNDRVTTASLLDLADWQLRDYWNGVRHEAATGAAYAIRGWYQDLYADVFRGKRVLEVGSGCGIDAVHFIRHGARWHFADIVPSNLHLIRRILGAFDLPFEGMTYIEDLQSIDAIPGGFDFIYCQGSMINAPFDFSRRETMHLLPLLRPGGRWIELCYPRERWSREGSLSFAEWGRVTDGDETPWMEWYDLPRLAARFAPVKVDPLMAFNFYNDDFNWFDLRIDKPPSRAEAAAMMTRTAARRLPLGLSPNGFKRHGSTTVEPAAAPGGPGIRVRTPPDLWAFALQGTLAASTLRQALGATPADAPSLPAIEVTLSVEEGRVGLGFLGDGLGNYVGHEHHVSPAPTPQTVLLPCPGGHAQYHLMLRNTHGGGSPSVAAIHALVLTTVPDHAEGGSMAAMAGDAPVVALSERVRHHLPAAETATAKIPVFVRAVAIGDLDRTLGYAEPAATIAVDTGKDYRDWTMAADDAPILAYLYRNHRPRRHLEFGTWEGFGATLCATHCDAEIWTLNLPEGERDRAGRPAYTGHSATTDSAPPISPAQGPTDAGDSIGWRYRAAGFTDRVHQVLVDSRAWDTSDIAPGFFDSVLVDGGHSADIVASDTDKALPLLRAGGLMLWHDFCPTAGPMTDFEATRGVVDGIHRNWWRWAPHFAQVFWVKPSFLLVGVKR